MTVASEKQAKDDKEKEMIEEIRDHLRFCKTNIGNVPKEQMTAEEKKDILDMIGRLLYLCTHGHWEEGNGPPDTPMSYIFDKICRKNGGIAALTGAIAGPRLEGWTRMERQKKDMLKAGLIRAVNYVATPEYQPQWLLPKDDVRNDHPGAVLYRASREDRKEEFKRASHAQQVARARRKQRIEDESKERLKEKAKTRKERAKHFKEQERKRSGKSGD